jgi:hypothetical protein
MKRHIKVGGYCGHFKSNKGMIVFLKSNVCTWHAHDASTVSFNGFI